jgi:pyridoxine 5-phosphate synthase
MMTCRQNFGVTEWNGGSLKPLFLLVGAEGFEPPAPCSQSRCSTRLSYAPTWVLQTTMRAGAWATRCGTPEGVAPPSTQFRPGTQRLNPGTPHACFGIRRAPRPMPMRPAGMPALDVGRSVAVYIERVEVASERAMAATMKARRGPGRLRLGVNIDHVATIRNARGGRHPDPLRAAHLAVEAGADGITAHLREDRRHIADADIARLKRELTLPLNFEMAATEEMLAIALRHVPHACCLVPEKREEKTTEGGLDVVRGENHLRRYVEELKAAGIRVSLFVEPDAKAIEAASRLGAQVVELHTGAYCDRALEDDAAGLARELDRLAHAARTAAAAGLEVHAGHGLTYNTVGGVARIGEVVELNIGHFLVGEAIFGGLAAAIARMRALMEEARAGIEPAKSARGAR